MNTTPSGEQTNTIGKLIIYVAIDKAPAEAVVS